MKYNKWHTAAYPFEFLQIMMDAEEKIHVRYQDSLDELNIKPHGQSKGVVQVYTPDIKRTVPVFVGKLWKCTMRKYPYSKARGNARSALDSIAYRTLRSITEAELAQATFASKIQLLKFWFNLQAGQPTEEKQAKDDSFHGYSEDAYKELRDSLDEFYVVKQGV